MPPVILSLLFTEGAQLNLTVLGSVPLSGEQVKYQLFNADTMELVLESEWIDWSSDGYVFEGLDQYTSYAVRYGLDTGEWDFAQIRHSDDFVFTSSDIILSMMQLHTQGKSERIGREHQEFEVYYSDFNRAGGAI